MKLQQHQRALLKLKSYAQYRFLGRLDVSGENIILLYRNPINTDKWEDIQKLNYRISIEYLGHECVIVKVMSLATYRRIYGMKVFLSYTNNCLGRFGVLQAIFCRKKRNTQNYFCPSSYCS